MPDAAAEATWFSMRGAKNLRHKAGNTLCNEREINNIKLVMRPKENRGGEPASNARNHSGKMFHSKGKLWICLTRRFRRHGRVWKK
jgi:hypothetical protein